MSMKVVRRPRVQSLSIEDHLEVLRAACAAQAERAAAVTASAKKSVALSREARRRRAGASGVLTLVVKRSA